MILLFKMGKLLPIQVYLNMIDIAIQYIQKGQISVYIIP